MNKVIHKYPLISSISAITRTIPLLPDTEVLHAGIDGNGDICIWVLTMQQELYNGVEVYNTIDRMFEVFATGETIPEDMGTDRKYIGTAITKNGFVWHVFERLN